MPISFKKQNAILVSPKVNCVTNSGVINIFVYMTYLFFCTATGPDK